MEDILFETPYELTYYDNINKVNITKKITFYRSEVNSIIINTESGSMEAVNADKSHKESGTVKVVSNNGDVEYDGNLEWIHGRGNSTWAAEKKPYNIKLKESVNILGLHEGQKYCLIANAYDNSSLRNWLAYKLAIEMGMQFSPDCAFTSLYLNGEHEGLYLLTDKIDIGDNSVDIANLENKTQAMNSKRLSDFSVWNDYEDSEIIKKGIDEAKNPKDITGGYLLELVSDKFQDKVSGFVSENGEKVGLKAPAYATKEQVEYISSFYQEMEDALNAENGINPYTGKHYSEYLDVDSFAKFYLIEELFMDEDAGIYSFFMYKDIDIRDKKLYAGPIWDFDLSTDNFGNEWKKVLSKAKETVYAGSKREDYDGLLYLLCRHKGFMKRVKEIYFSQVVPCINDVILEQQFTAVCDEIKSDAALNYIRWGNNISFSEEIHNLMMFFPERTRFLNTIWSDDEEYLDVEIDLGLNYRHIPIYKVKSGDTVKLLIPERGGNTFLGWYYKGTYEEFQPNTPIYESIQLEAHWESDSSNTDNKTTITIIKHLAKRYIFIVPIGIFAICMLLLIYISMKSDRRPNKNE